MWASRNLLYGMGVKLSCEAPEDKITYILAIEKNKTKLHCQHVFTCTDFFLVLHIEAPVSSSLAGRELDAFREMHYFSADNTGTVKQQEDSSILNKIYGPWMNAPPSVTNLQPGNFLGTRN